MIVIDVGCARHGTEYSVERLLRMFRPSYLLGFDPDPHVSRAMPSAAALAELGGKTAVDLRREAAWTFDGEVGFVFNGSRGHVEEGDPRRTKVRCVDLARVIEEAPEPVVLKLDCEGNEYELLEHLIERGAVSRLSRILIEWHKRAEPERRREIMRRVSESCPVEQWHW